LAMGFLVTLFIISAVFLGILFCIFLIGGIPFQKREEDEPVRLFGSKYPIERLCVGASTLIFGISWTLAWYYFFLSEASLLTSLGGSSSIHLILHSAAGFALLMTSVAVFQKWKNVKRWLAASMSCLVASTALAIAVFSQSDQSEQFLMVVFSIWTICVGIFLTTSVFMLDYITHELDDQLPHFRRQN